MQAGNIQRHKIGIEEIDQDLANRIRDGVFEMFRHVPQIYTVKTILAYLANNPIEPPRGDAEMKNFLSEEERTKGISWTAAGAAIEWQRIAYLKGEPEYPEELTQAIEQVMGSVKTDWVDKLALKCYDLGRKAAK